MSNHSVHFIHPEVGVRSHLVKAAQSLIGRAKYCFLSEHCHPPRSLNCGMLIYWVFSQLNYWGPNPPNITDHLLTDLQKKGVRVEHPRPGDLIFIQQPGRDHQHVGILNFQDAVVHACWKRASVVTDPVAEFCKVSITAPCYISFCENSICLTPYDVGQYLRQELSPELNELIYEHTQRCIDCEFLIESIRRNCSWRNPPSEAA